MESQDEYPFLLHWIWGHKTSLSAINLMSFSERKIIFYAAGPVGICYDWVQNKQYLLLAHKNDIVSIAATPDRQYLVSADAGEENALIIWHAMTRTIYHALYDFPSEGVVCICFSTDGKQLMTLNGGTQQEINIWDWKNKKTSPDFTYKFKESSAVQHYIIFHPVFPTHFASSGEKCVYFFEKRESEIKSAILEARSLYDEKASNQMGNFTQTAFSKSSSLAVTATTKGIIVLWARPLHSKEKPAPDSEKWLLLAPEKRVCIRMIQVMESRCAISFLRTLGNFFMVGTARSEILYYDENFSTLWSRCFNQGQINGVSFLHKPKIGFKGFLRAKMRGKKEQLEAPFEADDFVLSTVEGFVGYYTASSKQLVQVLWGGNHSIKSIAVHPVWPCIYFGYYNGCLQQWNYDSKNLINAEVYESQCSQIHVISIDSKGAYAACVMSNGNLVIFDAVCFSAKPCFTADEIRYKPTRIHFSPDSQHLLVTDASAAVTHYRLQLLVDSKKYEIEQKSEISTEEPFWSYGGKSLQHQGRIVDSIFSVCPKSGTQYFYTLGEDHYLVQYNITKSRGLDIEISKRIYLEKRTLPMCMTMYPLYEVSDLMAILSDDGKMRVYSVEEEKLCKVVSLPKYDEPIKRIIFLSKFKHLMEKAFPQETNTSEVFEYLVFNCDHVLGLSKFPIDGNPNTNLGLTTTPGGINCIVPCKDQTYLFTAGSNDCWVFMYEINIAAILNAEKEGGEDLDAFKYLFPTNHDPDDMKKKLVYAVYSLEIEKKMLAFGKADHRNLIGEIPIDCLQYVLAVIGLFVTPNDLQLMWEDIEFENRYLHNKQKRTLTTLDIMKLYVNYRPAEPVTINKLKQTFRNILVFEEDPDMMTRSRFIDLLTTRGDVLSHNELVKILKCLRNTEEHKKEHEYSAKNNKDELEMKKETSQGPSVMEELNKLIPDYITEEVFIRDMFCLTRDEEDLSKYILKEEDYQQVQDCPKLEDFVNALQEE